MRSVGKAHGDELEDFPRLVQDGWANFGVRTIGFHRSVEAADQKMVARRVN